MNYCGFFCIGGNGSWQNIFMYFNYHAKVKRLIAEGHLIGYEFVESYHGISPALVLYFDNHSQMPIREHRFLEYLPLIENKKKP